MTSPGRTGAAALAAVARRDFRIQRTYPEQFLLLMANIPFVLFTYFFLGRLVGHPAPLAGFSGGYFEFALIGFIMMTFAAVALTTFAQTITAEANGGTFELLLACAGTRLWTVLAGAAVVPVAIATTQATVLLAAGAIISGAGFHFGAIGLILPLVLLTIVVFGAFGVGSAAFILLAKRGDPLSTLLLEATSLVSGALFPIALFPGPLRLAARLFPAYYGFEGMRELLLAGGGLSDVAGEIAVLAVFAAALVPLSLRLFRGAIALSRDAGTLGTG